MAHVAPIYPSFARGEVSPLMLGRIDIEQYPTCLEKCRNAYVRPYGCVSRLTGTEYIASTKNNGKARLLKFVFSPTDSYIIECGAGYFRFYQNGAPVTSGGNIYEVSNDYYEDQLDSIQYVQIDDIIKLTCLPHNNNNSTAKPKELIRNGSANWTFRNVTFVETPYLDANISNITMKPSNESGNITITASSNYFTSSMVGANMWIGTKVKDSSTNKDVQGFVKITGYTSATEVTATVQSKLSVNNVATKLWGEGAFSDRRGYPSVVALYDGRLYYARTPYQPRNVYGSKPYAYETFTPAVDNEDDAGINIQLATNANGDGSDIKWMIGGSYLLCGTYGGEFVIRGTGDGAITPTDISARQRTNWGGEPVQPIVAGSFVHFIQRNGNKLRQFQYDFYYDAYKAVDVSIFSEHLLSSPIKAMALQKNPDSIIYLMRKDGKVVMLTLEQDQSVQAWSLLEDMGANVESIQTIPSYDGNYDEVYMVMQRNKIETTLTPTSSNPNVTITENDYSGTKVAGTEIIELTYDGFYEIWTNPESTKRKTKLSVTATGDLVPSTSYDQTKPNIGTETEVLEYVDYPITYNDNLNDGSYDEDSFNAITNIDNGAAFVALAETGDIFLSRNGRIWNKQSTTAHVDWKAIAYKKTENDSQLLFFGTGGHYSLGNYDKENNIINWVYENKYDAALSLPFNIEEAAYGNGIFLVLGRFGEVCISSDDGYTWSGPTRIDKLYNTSHNWKQLAYGDGYFIAIANGGKMSISEDGLNWSDPVAAISTYGPKDLQYNGVEFIYFDNNGRLANDEGYASIWRFNIVSGEIVTSSHINKVIPSYKFEFLSIDPENLNTIFMQPSGELYIIASGAWQSQKTGNIVDLSNDIYKISYNGVPVFGDTFTCVWSTIEGKVDLYEDYKIGISGTPENGDVLTLTYNSEYTSPIRHIERMANPITPENIYDWWYVRSGLKYDGYALTKGNKLTLSANSGTVTATANSSIFVSSMVGNRIRFIDSNYNVLGEGEITGYTSGTVVTLNITTSFQSLEITGGEWGISTDTLSGLDHLIGRTVQVYADGIAQENKEVTTGSIDIDDAFLVVVGLPYTSYITTMPMEAGSQNGTAVGKRKRISEMAIRVWNSLGVRVGRDLDNLYDTIYEQKEPFTGVIPNIKYNQGWVWDANITVEQSNPYPMNILSIAPLVTEVDK